MKIILRMKAILQMNLKIIKYLKKVSKSLYLLLGFLSC